MSLLKSETFPIKLNDQSKAYFKFITEIYEYLEDGEEFFDSLKDLIAGNYETLNAYNPINFYWVHHISNLIELFELTQTLKTLNPDPENLTDEENIVFDEWTKSDYTEEFLEDMNNKVSIFESSSKLLPKYKKQIESICYLHIIKVGVVPTDYLPDPDLGDYQDKAVIVQDPTQHVIPREDVNLAFVTWDELNKEAHLEKINKAINLIKIASPNSFDRFRYFTNVIIPHNNNHVVSYSSQFLPGYSVLNLYNRDFIDLLDDLIHENGHHHLNTYLNSEDLLNEDDELIYYSPWREELRPIRGVYHAFTTFYWAFSLFEDLSNFIQSNNHDFTQEQVEKIQFRLLEEYLMLHYCIPDLEHGLKTKKITETGYSIITDLIDCIKDFEPEFNKLFEQLNPEIQKIIRKLSILLIQKREKYKLT